MLRRRRPLARAAVLGTAVYAGNKAGQNKAMNQQREEEQEERLQQLEAQQYAQQPQQYAPPPPQQYAPPPPPAAAPAGGGDVVSQLTELAKLRDAGVLSPEEFEAAKAKLLA
jgi:Short C-terminal domain